MAKKSTNALMGATSGFSLTDSFGPQPALIVPTEAAATTKTADLLSSCELTPVGSNSFRPPVQPVPLSPTASMTALHGSPSTTPSVSQVASSSCLDAAQVSLGPPPTGLFLLPSSGPAASFTIGPPSGGVRKSHYVQHPGIESSSSVSGLQCSPSTSALDVMVAPSTDHDHQSSIHHANSVPDFMRGTHPHIQDRLGYGGEAFDVTSQAPATAKSSSEKRPEPLVHHWFYKEKKAATLLSIFSYRGGGNEQGTAAAAAAENATTPESSSRSNSEVWKPFSMIDSEHIEQKFGENPQFPDLIPTDGGRYDVNVRERTKSAVFWTEDEPMEIRRCSWFHQSNFDKRWIPYEEYVSEHLEKDYRDGHSSGVWSRKISLVDGDYIMFYSPTVMLHYPATAGSPLDVWGQVQPPMEPRVVHRGLEGLPEIPDGHPPGQFDHLLFVVHGIGSACDMKLRSIVSVTDGMRQAANEMSERHFSYAQMSGKVKGIEFLPVDWHKTLHGEDQGTDSRLKPLTLKSIPKLRGFVNDTILDVLFYTSPVYCQTIVNTVVSEINRMYTLFMARNKEFKGAVSVIGHSLGALILFDVLSNQNGDEDEDDAAQNPSSAADLRRPDEHSAAVVDVANLSVGELFIRLDISDEYAAVFAREGIDVEAIMTCSEDDLKEGGLPLGPRKKLLNFIEKQRAAERPTGFEAYKHASVTSDVKYTVGPAGTGQPTVQYQQLLFKVSAFYALGSPIGMFTAVRGIECLGPKFKFPTCQRFFNIFHPFDPVAYRMEALIDKEYGNMKPVTIPHHKGRKRMHLELKDTVTKLMTSDFKQKLISSVNAALGTVYNIATGATSGWHEEEQQLVEKEVEQQIASKSDNAATADNDPRNPTRIDSELNKGNRIDHVLQEAPFESFNEYIFALSAHLCYWESEDTLLMMLKDVYGQMNIFADDAMSGGAETFATGAAAAPDNNVPTAVLAPPPTPMGGPMVGPPTVVNQGNAGIENRLSARESAAVGVTAFNSTAVSHPPPPFIASYESGHGVVNPPPANIVFSDSPIEPLFGGGPPPLGPGSLPPASTTVNKGYPKPANYPAQYPGSAVRLGMDPTAPIVSKSAPVGPPPSSGFVRR